MPAKNNLKLRDMSKETRWEKNRREYQRPEGPGNPSEWDNAFIM